MDYLLKNDRPIPEVEESLANFEALYKKLIEKHEEYIQLVDGDEEFAAEEDWIDDCQQRFMQLQIKTKDYLKVKSQGQSVESNNVIENEIITETTLEPSETEVTISGNGEQENEANPGSSQGPSQQGQGQTDGANLGSSQGPSPQGQNSDSSNSESTQVNSQIQHATFKMEKPKLPRFSGDVRVHLVKRSFNTMKGVGRPHDLDNNHMLSLIEQKMCIDDRKIWARELEREDKPACLQRLMSWMETEMKSRMRATAPLRSPGQNPRHINHLAGGKPPKCWVCDNSTHWVDQCEKFNSMSPDERLKAVRENHACFSCLKKAGRDHRASNCSRRKQCTQRINGLQCKYYHHTFTCSESTSSSECRIIGKQHRSNATSYYSEDIRKEQPTQRREHFT